MESVSVEISSKNGGKTIINSIYRSPNTNIALFNKYIEDHLKRIGHKRNILCRDFNIDLLENDLHLDTSAFLELFYSHGMFPVINRPIRIVAKTATLINNIFLNDLKQQTESGIIISDISDHLPVFVMMDIRKSSTKSNIDKLAKHNLKPENINKLTRELQQRLEICN